MYQFIKQKILFGLLFTFFLFSCLNNKKNVSFPNNENDYKNPEVVKVKEERIELPKKLPIAKYTTQKFKLLTRDTAAKLKAPAKYKAKWTNTTNLEDPHTIKISHTYKKILGEGNVMKLKGEKVLLQKEIKTAILPEPNHFEKNSMTDNDVFGFRNINQDQEMPSQSVRVILKDKLNRYWVGTTEGLILFEGNQFRVFTADHGLKDGFIYSLIEDQNGKIWIGTGGGFSIYDGYTFTNYSFDNYNKVLVGRSIIQDSKGNIWVGTLSQGLFKYDGEEFINYTNGNGLKSNKIYSLYQDKKGNIWVASRSGGVHVINDEKVTQYTKKHGLNSNNIMCFFEDEDQMWVGTLGGLHVIKDNEITVYTGKDGLSSKAVYDITKDSVGRLWICTYSGLNYLKNDHITRYTKKDGLTANYITTIKEGVNGTFLVGTQNGGLNILKEGAFNHFSTDNGLAYDFVLSIAETKDHKIYAGTQQGLSLIDQNKIFQLDNFPECIYGVLEDSDRKLWVSTLEGVYTIEQEIVKHYNVEQGLSNPIVTFLLEKSDGSIWISTYDGGINIYRDGSFTHLTQQEGLSNNAVNHMIEDSEGNVWVGTEGGLSIVGENQIINYTSKNGLYDNHVYSLLESKEKKIWVGTGTGIYIFPSTEVNDKKSIEIEYFNKERGLPMNKIYQLAEDDSGNIWVGTSKGLSQIIKRDNEYAFINYDRNDGLKYIDFNVPSNPIIITNDKNNPSKQIIWTSAGKNLIAMAVPEIDTTKTTRTYITDIEINQKKIQWGKFSNLNISNDSFKNNLEKEGIKWDKENKIAPYFIPEKLELKHFNNHLTFHFSGFKGIGPEDIKYKFILEGNDKEWSKISKENKVDYRNISPGKYEFKVRAKDRYHQWSNEATIKFEVLPPWWFTNWAKFLWIVVAIGILYGLYKIRIKAIQEQKLKLELQVEERTKEIANQKEEILQQSEELKTTNEKLVELSDFKESVNSMIVHDLKNPISSILAVSDHAKVKHSAYKMLNMVYDILDVHKLKSANVSLSKEKYTLKEIIEEALKQVDYLLMDKEITVMKSSDNVTLKVDYDLVTRVLVNLLTNAIKNSSIRSTIDIVSKIISENEIKISIIDKGIGIPKEKIDTIFVEYEQVEKKNTGIGKSTGLGLTFCKMAVEAHNGEIGVNSEVNKGSEFWFSLPCILAIAEEDKETDEIQLKNAKDIALIHQDREKLVAFVPQLKSFKMYESAEIEALLESVNAPKNSNLNEYIKQIIDAAYNNNEGRYQELIEGIE